MRIAFYAPMKPPTHASPSGDRLVARMLRRALTRAGHRVTLASRLRTIDLAGDPRRQARIRAAGGRTAARLVARWRQDRATRPDLWFTYHVYHKAPDWLGPPVSRALGIPYAIAEASHAPKQTGGPWAEGHAAAADALGAAGRVFSLNPRDVPCVMDLRGGGAGMTDLPPFLDARPFAAAAGQRVAHRLRLAARHGLAPDEPWLLAVAMMRPGDKQASYRLLADALGRLGDRPWRLLAAGDGEARNAVRADFGKLADRVTWLGEQGADALPNLYAACDLYVWPAVNEAWGMALLEAQAAGLPVVAGRAGGVGAVAADGETGLLTEPGDPKAFAAAVTALLDDPARRAAMAAAAPGHVARRHTIDAAAAVLDRELAALMAEHAR